MQSQNKISVIGVGPGDIRYLTKKAEKEIENSDLVIGYKTYINLLENHFPQKKFVRGKMGGEVERVKKAIKKAEKKRVSLISGGDPNIYALAGLTLEIAKKQGFNDKIEIIPGVTAMNALASNFSGLFQDKIAIISLSDYLSSWKKIKKRTKLATKKGFDLVFYNPKSKKRPQKLKKALNIVLKQQNKENEVIIGRQISRKREWIKKTTIKKALKSPIYDKIDMKTIVVVPSPNSKTTKCRNNKKTKIAGIGPGSVENMTKKVYKDIKDANYIFGSQKYIKEIQPILENQEIITHEDQPYKKRTSKRIIEARKLESKSIILSAGDPSIYGPNTASINGFNPIKEPGVSSFQALAAKSGAPLVKDVVILSPSCKNYLKTIKKSLQNNFGVISFNTNKKSIKSLKNNLDNKKAFAIGKNISRKNEEILIGRNKDLKLEELEPTHNWTTIIPNSDSFFWEKKGLLVSKRGYEEKYEY